MSPRRQLGGRPDRSLSVVWIDREHARLYHFSAESMERESLQDQGKDLYTRVAERIPASAHLLILGPGMGKFHLRSHFEDHRPDLARRIVGFEAMDQPTDAEIADYANRYSRNDASA